jgi:predicted small lipoprotein YifL
MFYPMKNIFSVAIMALLALLLSACGEREPAVIIPPKEPAAVVEAFLGKLRAGDKAGAAVYVHAGAVDELEQQFAADNKKLAAADVLTPRFADDMGTVVVVARDRTTIVYAAKKNDRWTTANVRASKNDEGKYRVEYWRVTHKAPAAIANPDLDPEVMKETRNVMIATLGAFGVLGVLGIVVLFWLLRRRPHLIVPEETVDIRASASTSGDYD